MRLVVVLVATLLLTACVGRQQVTPIPYAAPAGITHTEEYVTGADADARMFLQAWLPVNAAPKALLLYVPANVEHSGLIAPVAEPLALQGYGVYSVDLRDLGRSKTDSKARFARDHAVYVGDIASVLAQLRQRYPGVAVFGAGESVGALILLRGEIESNLSFDGLVLADPAYKPNPDLGVLHLPRFMASSVLASVGLIGRVAPGFPAVPSNLAINTVGCSKETRGELLRDPYVEHQWLPASYVTALADSQKVLDRGLARVRVPLMIMHGEKDRVVPVKSSREIIRLVGSTDKLLFVIPGGCHAEMLEDATQPHVVRMVGEWLGKRVAKQP